MLPATISPELVSRRRSKWLSPSILLFVPFALLRLGDVQASTEDPPLRVRVQAYTEALCIDCFHFVLEDLIPTYQLLGDEIIDLELVPFGNAQIVDKQSRTIQCQHGDAECDANSWEQCAIYVTKHNLDGIHTSYHGSSSQLNTGTSPSPTELILNYFSCLESALPMGRKDEPFARNTFLDCATPSGRNMESIDRKRLEECHDNPLLSWNLQLQAAHETPEDHTFVPWVIVNGKFMDPDNERLLHRVCEEYKAGGGVHPGCS